MIHHRETATFAFPYIYSMKVTNTRNPGEAFSFLHALEAGLASDRGLFEPKDFPIQDQGFFENLLGLPFPEMAFRLLRVLLEDEIPAAELKAICYDAFSFPVPLRELQPHIHILELFHGPSLAFKDFGARFMARVLANQRKTPFKPLQVLVATSGDTGGAVAMGFHQVPGITVTILFPKGRVTALQEMQLTRLGGNVRAIEVEGSFDDCQELVKMAFWDTELKERLGLTSANSINLGRLIPQMLYYVQAWTVLQQKHPGRKLVFSVPSGNFGNICAAAYAWKMGLPVHRLVASVNSNAVFPDYLETGQYLAKPSLPTISNAMDVGNPSNFERILSLMGSHENMQRLFSSWSFSDARTENAIMEIYNRFQYISEPHAAIAFLGLKTYLETNPDPDIEGVFLGTAHPSKFLPVLPLAIQSLVEIPEGLKKLQELKPVSLAMKPDFKIFRNFLLQQS
jgi:threonine synthase